MCCPLPGVRHPNEQHEFLWNTKISGARQEPAIEVQALGWLSYQLRFNGMLSLLAAKQQRWMLRPLGCLRSPAGRLPEHRRQRRHQ